MQAPCGCRCEADQWSSAVKRQRTATQVLVLTLPEPDRLPSRYEAALPLTLAARPSLPALIPSYADIKAEFPAST